MTSVGGLGALPHVSERRLAVRVTPDALRQIRGGHPWVYDGAIVSTSHQASAGDLAVVFDDKRRFVAIGLWDPTSPIRLRILHAGAPRPIDEAFWTERLVAALDRRSPLVDDERTTGYRCVNGESDGFPGLVLDRYGDTAVVKVYTPAWFPHLGTLVPLFVGLLGVDRLVVRLARSVARGDTHGISDGQVVVGHAPAGPVEFLEHGLVFGADVLEGQKTGHFLDQRDNRVLVGGLSAGADVLDVFACTGGFSVHAAAGGAAAVHSVDLAAPALRHAVANVARNRHVDAVRRCLHTTEVGDAFRVLDAHARAGRRWDVVVIDPPSFAPRQDTAARALRAYARLTALGLEVTRPGGVLVQSSCSSRVTGDVFHRQIRAVADDLGVRLEELARTGHPLDHPATFTEAEYLKTMFTRVEP